MIRGRTEIAPGCFLPQRVQLYKFALQPPKGSGKADIVVDDGYTGYVGGFNIRSGSGYRRTEVSILNH